MNERPPRRSDEEPARAWTQHEWENRWSGSKYEPHFRTDQLPGILEEALTNGWFSPKSTVLDLGCGSGEIAILLAQRGFTVLGVDFAPSAIDRARKASGQIEGVEFAVADVCSTGFDPGTFDVLLDRGCLHTLRREQRRAYASNLNRVSREGSRFLLMHRYPDPRRDMRQRAEEVLTNLVGADFELLESRSIEMQRSGGEARQHAMPGVALLFERRVGSQAP